MKTIAVWSASLDRPADEITALWNSLNAAERDRAARFHREVDRARYIAGRGTLRVLIGEYTSTPPDLVPLCVLPGGKPSLDADANPQSVHFNVSHCGGLALFAFSDHEVGIDVQRLEANDDMPKVVTHFFGPEEVALFGGLEESERARFFFRTWARKEAYLKATGSGLRTDPSRLCVGDPPGGDVRLTDHDGTTRIDRAYQVYDIDGLDDHVGAIAVTASPSPPDIRVRQWPVATDPAGEATAAHFKRSGFPLAFPARSLRTTRRTT